MEKILIISDKAKTINFRNRKVRTPVTLNVTDVELKNLKIQMRMADIQIWELKEKISDNVGVVDDDYVESSEVIIEELEKEPSTVLEKLMKTGECE